MTAVYTTGIDAAAAVLRAVRLALPELEGRVVQAYQRQADAPAPDEPYASVAYSPVGPVSHPVVDYPHESGTSTGTAAPHAIVERITVRHEGVIVVGIFGDDAHELTELLDARIHGAQPSELLRAAGVSLGYSPTALEDATSLVGDRWQYAVMRTFRIQWTRQDFTRNTGIDTITVPTVTLNQET